MKPEQNIEKKQSESAVDAIVMNDELESGGTWQKCPKCDGQGIVSKPPWIAGDQHVWTSSETSYTCNLCNGMMIIRL